MKTSTCFGSKRCLQVMALLGGLSVAGVAQAYADDTPPEAAGSDLKVFSGAWLCTVQAMNGNDTVNLVGTMHFAPWDAWTVGSFSPQDSNVSADSNGVFPNDSADRWPPHGGHGPVIQPPEGVKGSFPGNNLTFMAYDPVAGAYVSFKFLGSGVYAMASSAGPDSSGEWTWEGALSDNGHGTGALVRATLHTSDPNTFNMVGSSSTDMGQTWTPTGQARCVKQSPPASDDNDD